MDEHKTALMAKDMDGEALYQKRARQVFPLLVRQAIAGQKITYGDLAKEMGMPNSRNLNYVLGSVGTSLEALSKKWGTAIPPLQCLVVNVDTGMPGLGFDEFLSGGKGPASLTSKQRRALVYAALAKVFAYPDWGDVAAALGIELTHGKLTSVTEKARKIGHGGESEQHRALKEYVAANPASVGLSTWFGKGKTEYPLPSGDSVDVMFQRGIKWVAVEVKSCISDEPDIVRGLFQCVKYGAVTDAWRGSEGESADVRVVLALGAHLPSHLLSLKNTLGVEVVENVGGH